VLMPTIVPPRVRAGVRKAGPGAQYQPAIMPFEIWSIGETREGRNIVTLLGLPSSSLF